MLNFLKLNKEVSETSSALDEDDILNVKNKLKDFGYYKEPSYGMTPYSDNTMFDGIKNFQKDKGLKIDAIIKPKGETETKFNEVIKNNNSWGNKTEKALDAYIKDYQEPSGKIRTGIIAPWNDMLRNYDDMKKLDLIGGDKFAHCKANFEATKRGKWGATLAKTVDTGREAWGIIKGDGFKDNTSDWIANFKGINGAKSQKTLLNSCSRNPKDYYK